MASLLVAGRSVAQRLYDLKRNPPPKLRFGSGVGGSLLFVAPDWLQPSGGTMVLYRHVDILNEAGIPSVAIHRRRGFRYEWFANTTPVAAGVQRPVLHGDTIVVPEVLIPWVARLPRKVPHIVLNQNNYLTWARDGDLVQHHLTEEGQGLLGMVCTSDLIERFMTRAVPGLPVRQAQLGIDPEVFYPSDSPPEKVLTFLDRRGSQDALDVIRIVKAAGLLQGWRINRLSPGPQLGFAEQLRRSAIFMATSPREGFGLPPIEAMACGAYVVGYHGYGGEEFFEAQYSSPVLSGDLLGFADQLASVLRRERLEPGWLRARGLRAAQAVAGRYSPQNERSTVIAAYSELLR